MAERRAETGKPGRQRAEGNNANSAQSRKDQKRREAELRTLTQPLRKEITPSGKKEMGKSSTPS